MEHAREVHVSCNAFSRNPCSDLGVILLVTLTAGNSFDSRDSIAYTRPILQAGLLVTRVRITSALAKAILNEFKFGGEK